MKKSFLLIGKTKKTYTETLMTLAASSRASYQSVLNRLEEYCAEAYNGRTIDEIVKELKSIQTDEMDDAYYGVLQGYVNWLLKRNLSHKTVNNHFKVAKQYFSYQGIRADPVALRRNVNTPKEIKEKLHPLTLEEIHKIFAGTIQKRRMLYLVMIGSGMRIRECVSLRKKDFDVNHPKRIRIDIPAQFTKAKVAHTTFVSKEASHLLIPHLSHLQSHDLVFARNPDSYHASMTEIEAFTRYRDAAGLTTKYESANRHHITLHSFRSYFFTRARRVHDTDVAHGMVGHSTYLDMYDRKDDSERLELYLKVEPKLRIDFAGPSVNELDVRPSSMKLEKQLRMSYNYFARITGISEFEMRIALNTGFMLVTDLKKGNKLHRPTCRWLKASSFVEKIIKNCSKNGRYYWCNCPKLLHLARFDKCKICMKDQ